ncbi:PEPxxWA-CTERM sorting domain-containing protein [Sphingomonas quercus]|uniref:PEPxxWA-CTERM sorting domain-containing protein n=1 Tax=Sphingomonas quercus TaxID=2842451 RepID=A0ABS6BLH3_9SPHN|nr:PEPxxWA-CTERM sorting domain-containing protein [Sphingomonas quercus]MBU3078261.1 PEPxxWA-CTERM sorting domain-containing protein [Sphingomonas quercus]
MRKITFLTLCAAAACAAQPAGAQNVVKNGDFERVNMPRLELENVEVPNSGTRADSDMLPGWKTAHVADASPRGIAFLFTKPGGNVTYGGTNDESCPDCKNSNMNSAATFADHGNFVALEKSSGISQFLTDLTEGIYSLSFDYGGAQMNTVNSGAGFSYTLSAFWGDDLVGTVSGRNDDGSFTGWSSFSTDVTCDAACAANGILLRFVASLAGGPPVVLLDNVAVTGGAVPEPATWATMLLGFGVAGGVMRSGRRRAAIAAAA